MAQYDVDEPSVKRRRTQTGDAAGYSALGSASSHGASEASGLPNTRARVKNHWPEIVRALIVNRACDWQERAKAEDEGGSGKFTRVVSNVKPAVEVREDIVQYIRNNLTEFLAEAGIHPGDPRYESTAVGMASITQHQIRYILKNALAHDSVRRYVNSALAFGEPAAAVVQADAVQRRFTRKKRYFGEFVQYVAAAERLFHATHTEEQIEKARQDARAAIEGEQGQMNSFMAQGREADDSNSGMDDGSGANSQPAMYSSLGNRVPAQGLSLQSPSGSATGGGRRRTPVSLAVPPSSVGPHGSMQQTQQHVQHVAQSVEAELQQLKRHAVALAMDAERSLREIHRFASGLHVNRDAGVPPGMGDRLAHRVLETVRQSGDIRDGAAGDKDVLAWARKLHAELKELANEPPPEIPSIPTMMWTAAAGAEGGEGSGGSGGGGSGGVVGSAGMDSHGPLMMGMHQLTDQSFGVAGNLLSHSVPGMVSAAGSMPMGWTTTEDSTVPVTLGFGDSRGTGQ